MRLVRAAGFTLIELLTVIAIISILAGLTAVALPRALERARITDATSDMKGIADSLHGYYTDNGTYPPGYGYQLFQDNASSVVFNHHPYMGDIGINKALKAYDRFSQNYDTNGDSVLSRLEFIPLPNDHQPPLYTPPPTSFLDMPADQDPYPGGEPVANEDVPERENEQRPYVYVPYYKKDIDRMRRIAGENWDGVVWNNAFMTDDTIYPPPQYDAFVLLSVGPLENTRGLIVPPNGDDAYLATTYAATDSARAYYILAMRAAYLATRDATEDGQLDFDYIARTRQGQGKLHLDMPDQQNKGLAAPLIWKSE